MILSFETETIEETDHYIIYHHSDGVITKGLKEGTVEEQGFQ